MQDRHVYDIPATDLQNANIIAFVAKELFVLAATFTRISLCCFYYRLVKDTGYVWFQNIVHAAVAFNIIIGVVFFLLGIFQCW